MEPLHITWASRGRRTLFPREAETLAAARALARSGPLLFCVVDDHVHGVWAWQAGAGSRASGVCRSLAAVVRAPLQPGYRRVVEGRRHLLTLVAYLANQPAKHGLDVHPAAWIGSCVPDLLGARLLPGFDPLALRRLLPRWRPEHLASDLGLGRGLDPAGDDQVFGLGWPGVAAAAARAFGVVGLRGNARPVVRARRALFALASAHPGGVAAVCHLVRTHPDAARRMGPRADAAAIAAVRRSVALTLRAAAVGARP